MATFSSLVLASLRIWWSIDRRSFALLLLFLFKFFIPALANGFSLEFKWLQVSLSLQDSSQYSGRFQQCCNLDCLYSSSYFQVLQSLYKSFSNCTKSNNHDWYNRHFQVPQFFLFPSKVQVLILLFVFFQFYSVVSLDSKIYNLASSLLSFFFFFFFFIIIESGRLVEIRWSVCIVKSKRSLCVSALKILFAENICTT